MTNRILVTGGCGFVGRHLVSRLLRMGNEVVIVDDLSTGIDPNLWVHPQYEGKFTFYKMDSRDFLRTMAPTRFSDVYHLSAVVGGRLKIDRDPIAVAQDLAIDAEFFNWIIRSKCDRILYASSSAAYPVNLQGKTKHVKLKENMISFEGNMGVPDMTYGWSKLTGEFLATLAAKHYGTHIACVRPFSGYGEDQDKTYPVPAITQRAVNREDPLVIWGSGKQGRDFVHIEDCIDVMLLAIGKISDGSAVNISSGKLTTFLEVASLLATIAEYSPKLQVLTNMPQGVHARFGSVNKTKKILGWTPKISLKEGLKRVFDYANNNTPLMNMLFPEMISH